MIKVRESKVEKMADKAGKALRSIGELMTCIDEIQNGYGAEEMGERTHMGDYRTMSMPNGYHQQTGYREPYYDPYRAEEWQRTMGERRVMPMPPYYFR